MEQQGNSDKIAEQELPFINETHGCGYFEIKKPTSLEWHPALVPEIPHTDWKADLLNNLSKLRKANYRKELRITVDLIDNKERSMTRDVAQSLVDTFLHYSALQQETKGKKWSIQFDQFCDDCPHFHEVLRVICATQLFKELQIICIGEMSHKMAFALRYGMINNKGLEEISTESLEICEETAFVLGDGLRKTTSLKRLYLKGDGAFPTGFTELFDPNDTCRAHVHLVEGLKENSTLETLDLALTNLPDTILAPIVEALQGHPTLKKLSLYENRCGELTIQALHNVLRCSGVLTCLWFSCEGWSDELERHKGIRTNIDSLVAGLQANNSIRELSLSGYHLTHSDLDKLFDGLSKCQALQVLSISECDVTVELSRVLTLLCKCPQLVNVDVSNNKISRLGSCKVSDLKPTRLMSLNLSFNPLVTENLKVTRDWQALVHMLQVSPYLRSLGGIVDEDAQKLFEHQDAGKLFSPQVANLLDTNNCRIAFNLFRDDAFPLSCWPNVLERVSNSVCSNGKDNDPARQVSISYQLLQGFSNRFTETSAVMKRPSSKFQPSLKRQRLFT